MLSLVVVMLNLFLNKMNIVFISEQPFIGKVDDDFTNWRTEYVWFKMLDAFHISYEEIAKQTESKYHSVIDTADLIILIPSKNNPQYLTITQFLKNKKIGIMQEGPNTLWQDWPVAFQFYYLQTIKLTADIIFCHNEYDKKYFEGITTKPVIVLPTVHDINKYQTKAKPIEEKDESCFIGGNLTRWYNGMTSYLLIKNNPYTRITFPTMGRKQPDEEEYMKKLDNRIEYLPYKIWAEFIDELTTHKYAIHLMPEIAAGSFSLNCAMLGIPCIGNIDDDTQRKCFPELSINVNDTKKATSLMNRLCTDSGFYKTCSEHAKNIAKKEFDCMTQKEKILQKINKVLENGC